MKNIIKISLTAYLFLMPLTVFAASFSDVPESHQNFEAIEYLHKYDVINGYEDGTFRPENEVSRAESLKMIFLTSTVNVDEGAEQASFSDVKEDSWFNDFVNTAVKENIVNGYEDGTFRPHNYVNLAEALKISFESFDIAQTPDDFEDPYPDVPKEWWFAPYASFAASKNITSPANDGFLHAEKEITRAELAELLYRFDYVENNDLEAFPTGLDGMNLVESGRKQIGVVTQYDTSYYEGGYPPEDRGACTDVIEQALRDNSYDLKSKIDNDMYWNPSRYSRDSDPNINYRRVVNVKTYLDYNEQSLSTCIDPECFEQGIWQPGDIVTYDQMEGGLWHIAIISDKTAIAEDGKTTIPLIIHNYSFGTTENNLLLTWPAPISGHYRIFSEFM